MQKGYVLGPDEGVPGAGSDLKASRVSTAGGLTLIESHTTGGAPMHIHSREDEYFYMLEGSLTVRCGDDTFKAGPRSFVFLPRGVSHAWDVDNDTATLLMMTAPAGLEEFLHEYHQAGGAPSEVKDQIAAKYGITWVHGS